MLDNEAFVKSVQDAAVCLILQEAEKMEKACLILENAAKRKCSPEQETLRASLLHEVEVTANDIIGRNGSNLKEAPYIHNGTAVYAGEVKGMKIPQRFLEEAKLENREKIERALGD